jgi:hypothetical protein
MFYEARGRKKYYYGMIAQMLNRSTAPSITYTCCCAIVLMLHNDGGMVSWGLDTDNLSTE